MVAPGLGRPEIPGPTRSGLVTRSGERGEPIVPSREIGGGEVGVGPAGVGNDEDPGRAQPLGLRTQRRPARLPQGEAQEAPVRGHPVEAHDTRRRPPQALPQARRPSGEVGGREASGVGRRTLHDIGEADAEIHQQGIVLGPQHPHTQPPARHRAKP